MINKELDALTIVECLENIHETYRSLFALANFLAQGDKEIYLSNNSHRFQLNLENLRKSLNITEEESE